VLVRDFSEKINPPQDEEKTGLYSGQFLLKWMGIITLIWIVILLLFYLS